MTADFVAVDAGQSSIRVRHGSDLTTLPGLVSGRSPLAQCVEAIVGAMDGQLPPTVAVGLSGRGREAADDLLVGLSEFGVRRAILAHDSVTSYLGALGTRHGAVIAAGTGTICLAVGEEEVARVDGWGHLVGDAGSAFWIGREGMAAAMRGHDGRGPSTPLSEVMAREHGDLDVAYLALQTDPAYVARVAAFARRVDELQSGDPVARGILDRAAALLAETVVTSLQRVGLMAEVPQVVPLGGVFSSESVTRGFVTELRRVWPEFDVTSPEGQGIDGAVALALDEIPCALRAHISTAAA